MGKFINPFTDWGFKYIFGREVSKDILIDFLNDLLNGEHVITDLRFLNNERLPEEFAARKVIYDIYCETDTGEHIIVEMQNREQPYFRDRGLFYMSRAVVQQAVPGNWDFRLNAVYGVFFMNFCLDNSDKDRFRRDIALTDMETGEVFNKKFRQIYIELPRFYKEESECETDFERWIYVLKNMETLERMPFKARKAVFDRLEQLASRANLTREQRQQYDTEWKIYNDYFNTIDFAEKKGHDKGLAKGLAEGRVAGLAEGRVAGLAEGRAEGRTEGLAEGRAEGRAEERMDNARSMKALGVSSDIISQVTGLSLEEIGRL